MDLIWMTIWVKGVAVEIFCMTKNKGGRKLLSHLSELSSHLVLRSAAEAIASPIVGTSRIKIGSPCNLYNIIY